MNCCMDILNEEEQKLGEKFLFYKKNIVLK